MARWAKHAAPFRLEKTMTEEKAAYQMTEEELAVAHTAALDTISAGNHQIKQGLMLLQDIQRERFVRAITKPKRVRKSKGT
jgi:hypothetical protein